uniref:SMP-30/Gluconolactonase/LRE-like region domain-containing protein n=1 Tax=Globisporangium ultimum (strain ATCC 200006 / CBS 805.95 / DAOM BR144) TaxID=431595 RepID=K3W6N1_GLOUD
MCSSDDGRYLFLCDTGHHKIKFAALPGSSGLISAAEIVAGVEIFTFAGDGKKAWRDGPVLDCSFNSPTAVWQCADGTIVVADTGNHCIRQIVRTGKGNLVVRTIAGGYASYQIPGQERMPENMDVNEFQHLNKRNAGFRDGRLMGNYPGTLKRFVALSKADTLTGAVKARHLANRWA